MIETETGVVEHHPRPAFLCRARWRCFVCDSPWFGATSFERAWELLRSHRKAGCP